MIHFTPLLKLKDGAYSITSNFLLLKKDATKLYHEPPVYEDALVDYCLQLEPHVFEDKLVVIQTEQTNQLERDWKKPFVIVESINDNDLIFQPCFESLRRSSVTSM